MQLISASIKNFRLLRDLELNFSTDPVKKLTVFRAPNETGKTTIVRALRWALYGDDGLPNKGVGWRMHPIDWDVNESPQVQITVSVEFEISRFISIGAKKIESRQRYRISRSAIERISADGKEWTRTDASVKLFEMSEAGSTPIEPPEAIIRDELPTELRDIFFTDGDKAMDFIEADTTTSSKRARVRKAIRSLLGLGIIKSSISHIENAAREANKRAKKIGG
ncbi:MAG: AAA family ATPase, partial [Deltaproteobacteria bacterium]|nr:AAA family ATPase [Deltaproteobacteria bacterium]